MKSALTGLSTKNVSLKTTVRNLISHLYTINGFLKTPADILILSLENLQWSSSKDYF